MAVEPPGTGTAAGSSSGMTVVEYDASSPTTERTEASTGTCARSRTEVASLPVSRSVSVDRADRTGRHAERLEAGRHEAAARAADLQRRRAPRGREGLATSSVRSVARAGTPARRSSRPGASVAVSHSSPDGPAGRGAKRSLSAAVTRPREASTWTTTSSFCGATSAIARREVSPGATVTPRVPTVSISPSAPSTEMSTTAGPGSTLVNTSVGEVVEAGARAGEPPVGTGGHAGSDRTRPAEVVRTEAEQAGGSGTRRVEDRRR